MKYRLPVQAGLMLASLLLVCVVRAEELFDADGYRSSQYRSPTPSTLEGVQVLDTPALQKLLDERPDVQLVDVYRQLWRHDRFIEEEPHANIPGSLWLPNTGSGNLEALWLRYFTHYLDQASKGDLDKPFVFYCRPDCWPSWNAARRAHAMGYRQLYWYRDGIDSWEQAGLPLVPAQPAELPAAFLTPTATP
ncbi:PQQ-dependent catabolism-associated CXXCW motif protein [Ectopseudomonas chengduensis]|jgi:PQQ-dependent catabolism-associated CXXCW motif protein|nr:MULTISPECIES: PQQ-dependent catabolism-associated CXXCW motif protein [Pseudomonas]MDH1560490.1 PQQ-dependent catabolism-associated CXXCW motif protein [Pseudomonas chengduensis]MDH1731232.1 PQQ-dependent catabolism-associated CXXCW motif protein [Pseudomonas chengduensis]TXR38504.1 PQQ-dependent catabolism-associated CXXCW motif protein [Pseudomonas mendocina]